jgi:cell division protease FtsH
MADKKPEKKEPRSFGLLALWALSFVLLFLALTWGQLNTISYSDFKSELARDNVKSVVLEGDSVTGQFRESFKPKGSSTELTRFTTAIPAIEDPVLAKLLNKDTVSVEVRSASANGFSNVLLGFLPWLVLGWLVYSWLSRTDRPQTTWGFSKSKAVLYRKSSEDLTFEDVAGLSQAKRELSELVDFLKEPAKYLKLGARSPQGILLMGPPGTGKTLMARAVAGEANVPFFSISGSQFIEMFVGVGASRVRSLFSDAKRNAPSIIFIDEIDSVGRARGTGLGGGHDEREQTLNQILAEMDGFSRHDSVVVLAATNRPDVLDPALTRPGRFDRKVVLDLPQKSARQAILRLHTRGIPVSPEVDLADVARRTTGFSGAELQNLVNEAALLAARKNEDRVSADDFEAAQDRIVLGTERDEPLTDEERERVAYHEAGHALLAAVLSHAAPLRKVTIIPRGRALGVTEQTPSEESTSLTSDQLCDQITILLGGRAAVEIIYKTRTTGASNDLQRATQLARKMVTRFGMSKALGAASFSSGEEYLFLGREMAKPKDFSEHTGQLIDQEIVSLLHQMEKRAHQILHERRAVLEALAERLLDRETLDRQEILQIVEGPATPRIRETGDEVAPGQETPQDLTQIIV